MVQPKMAVMWHCHVTDGYIDPVFESVASSYSGAVTLCQDLTVFNVTPGAVVARQTDVNPVQAGVMGPSATPRTVGVPLPSPSWWADAAIDWQAKLG